MIADLVEVALLLIVIASSLAIGALVMKRRLDAAWRARLRRSEAAWARAYWRLSQGARRHGLEVITGGHDDAA